MQRSLSNVSRSGLREAERSSSSELWSCRSFSQDIFLFTTVTVLLFPRLTLLLHMFRPLNDESLISRILQIHDLTFQYNSVAKWDFLGFSGKESTCQCRNTRDAGLIPGSGRFPGVGNGNPLQYSSLEKFHKQRILAGYSPQGHKVATEHRHTLSMHVHTHTHTHTMHSC